MSNQLTMKYFTTSLLLSFFIASGTAQQDSLEFGVGGDSQDFVDFNSTLSFLEDFEFSGHVTFNIAPGVYDESIDLGSLDIPSSLSILFRSQSESSDDTKIAYSGPLEYALRLHSNSNIRFENLSIHRYGGHNNALISDCDSISFDNCSIVNSSNLGAGTNVYGLEVFSSSGLEFDQCVIESRNENNWSNSHSYGMILEGVDDVIFSECFLETYANYGQTYTAQVENSVGVSITSCSFYDQAGTNNGYGGVRVMLRLINVDSASVHNNVFQYGNSLPITSQLMYCSNVSASEIEGNEFINPSGWGLSLDLDSSFFVGNSISQSNELALRVTGDNIVLRDLQILDCEGGGVSFLANNSIISNNQLIGVTNGDALVVEGDSNVIHSNFIQADGDLPSFSFVNKGMSNEFYFNTLRMDGTHSDAKVWRDESSSGTIGKNNILVNYGGGQVVELTNSAPETDYNNYYSAGDVLGVSQGVVLLDLLDLQDVLGGDSSSLEVDPYFETADSPFPNHGSLNAAAIPVLGLDVDLYGEPRDANAPDMGAVEFQGCGLDVGIAEFVGLSSPASPVESVVVRLFNHGTEVLNSATINWQVNDGDVTSIDWTGSLTSGDYEDVFVGDYVLGGYALYNFHAWASAPNGLEDCNMLNDASFKNNISAPMCGEYSIGDEFGFPTINQALESISASGIACSVTFNIAPGVYDESIDLGSLDIPSSLSILFRSQSESSDDTKIAYSGPLEYALRLHSNSNIRFENLSIHRYGGHNNALISDCDSISFDNCSIVNSSNLGAGTNVYGLEVFSSSGLEFDQCVIESRNENNWSNSHSYGMILEGVDDVIFSECFLETYANYGQTYTAQVENSVGVSITSCSFYDQAGTNNGYGGVRVMLRLINVDSASVHNNVFQYGNSLPITSQLMYCSNVSASEIEGNEFINPSGWGLSLDLDSSFFVGNSISQSNELALRVTGDNIVLRDLQILDCEGGGVSFLANNSIISNNQLIGVTNGDALVVEGDSNVIHSNFIQADGDLPSFSFVNKGMSNEFYFNTLRMDGTHSDAKVWRDESSSGTIGKNNILVNYGGGQVVELTNSAPETDYNNYYSAGDVLGVSQGVVLLDLLDLQDVLGGDSSSLEVDPYFETADSPFPNHGSLNAAAIPVLGLDVDLYGEPRDANAPDMGAVEFQGCGLDVGLYCPGCTDAEALNYSASANADDESCLYGGCLYDSACNYNPEADQDDGSCDFSCLTTGCSVEGAINFDIYADGGDDSGCLFIGCQNEEALNFDVEANFPGACIFLDACPGDFIPDGHVDINDLLNFFQLWGEVCPWLLD